ncbi:MAG TPA: NUDIX hydrolase [Candidatus Babeliales bacterium]|nr:NUDIX hydrolase [Candidatus Babeliales bacterium]HLC07609.1 NUDIX hydrolase [Candidatus Babeliales bacterium]
MLKKQSILLPLALLLGLTSCVNTNADSRLSSYAYRSASVLPVVTYDNDAYVILSREAFGKSRGTYDDFGGSRDKGEGHPVITAAREFYEEAILGETIGLTIAEVQDYIDINTTNNTGYIVAHSQGRAKNVTYITDFDCYKTKFLDSFYQARHNATDVHLKEKDRIAVVKWTVLEETFAQSKKVNDLTIKAFVLSPKTKTYHPAHIKLRPYFVKKLRPFFVGEPYTQGLSKKIRFYGE